MKNKTELTPEIKYQLKAGDPSTSSGQSFVKTNKMLLIK